MTITKSNFDKTHIANLDSGEFGGRSYYFDEHEGGVFTVSKDEFVQKQFTSEYHAREYFLYCIGVRTEDQAIESGVI